jgi:hypothetical protein
MNDKSPAEPDNLYERLTAAAIDREENVNRAAATSELINAIELALWPDVDPESVVYDGRITERDQHHMGVRFLRSQRAPDDPISVTVEIIVRLPRVSLDQLQNLAGLFDDGWLSVCPYKRDRLIIYIGLAEPS